MKSELNFWNITTARAANLAIALEIMLNTRNAAALACWPMKEGFLVVAKFRILPN